MTQQGTFEFVKPAHKSPPITVYFSSKFICINYPFCNPLKRAVSSVLSQTHLFSFHPARHILAGRKKVWKLQGSDSCLETKSCHLDLIASFITQGHCTSPQQVPGNPFVDLKIAISVIGDKRVAISVYWSIFFSIFGVDFGVHLRLQKMWSGTQNRGTKFVWIVGTLMCIRYTGNFLVTQWETRGAGIVLWRGH